MVPHLRRAFNEAFTEERYRAYCRNLDEATGTKIEFRVAETPVFLPAELRADLTRAAVEIIDQLLAPEHQAASLEAVPADFDVPGCDDHPLFVAVDFAITREGNREDGPLRPRLIELQGFPSLFGFQYVQSLESRRYAPDGERLAFLLSGLDDAAYRATVSDAILGGHSPENVVLMDLDPETQKTVPDFHATTAMTGVRAVCPTKVTKRGRELWYERDGRPTRILRVYNRLIVDELQAKKVELPFSYTEPLDLEWAGHPNWYFRWSKHSLPHLHHPAVPEARLLSSFDRWPDDLGDWVFKPLFSFAGAGVKVDVTPADLDGVPAEHRPHSMLMRKVEYAPVIATADGNFSKCEVRVLVIFRNGRPLPVTTLIRLSQGKMMGVDFNKNRTWVGSAAGLWEP